MKHKKHLIILISSLTILLITSTLTSNAVRLDEKINQESLDKLKYFQITSAIGFSNLIRFSGNIILSILSGIPDFLASILNIFIKTEWIYQFLEYIQRLLNTISLIVPVALAGGLLFAFYQVSTNVENGKKSIINALLRYLVLLVVIGNIFFVPLTVSYIFKNNTIESKPGTIVFANNTYDILIDTSGNHYQNHKCDTSKIQNDIDSISGLIKPFEKSEDFLSICSIDEKLPQNVWDRGISGTTITDQDLSQGAFNQVPDEIYRYGVDFSSAFVGLIFATIIMINFSRAIPLLFVEQILLSIYLIFDLLFKSSFDNFKQRFKKLIEISGAYILGIMLYIFYVQQKGNILGDLNSEYKIVTTIILDLIVILLINNLIKAKNALTSITPNIVQRGATYGASAMLGAKAVDSFMSRNSDSYNRNREKVKSSTGYYKKQARQENIIQNQQQRKNINNDLARVKTNSLYKVADQNQKQTIQNAVKDKYNNIYNGSDLSKFKSQTKITDPNLLFNSKTPKLKNAIQKTPDFDSNYGLKQKFNPFINKEKFENQKQINKNLSEIQNNINQKQQNDFMNKYQQQKQEAVNQWNKQINPEPVKFNNTETQRRILEKEQEKYFNQIQKEIKERKK